MGNDAANGVLMLAPAAPGGMPGYSRGLGAEPGAPDREPGAPGAPLFGTSFIWNAEESQLEAGKRGVDKTTLDLGAFIYLLCRKVVKIQIFAPLICDQENRLKYTYERACK